MCDSNDMLMEDNSIFMTDALAVDTQETLHYLSDKWTLWAHLPHDIDWSLKSYKVIAHIESIEQGIAINDLIPDKMVKNCMLFVMRDGISPIWEDPANVNGGCFSYKIANKHVHEAWNTLFYSILGESASKNKKYVDNMNGITISPKKNFCILKIWMKSCEYQNANELVISKFGDDACIFKRHNNN